MDSARLSGALEFARATNLPLHRVTVIRHGALVLDAYFYPYGPGLLHDTASVTKSVTSPFRTSFAIRSPMLLPTAYAFCPTNATLGSEGLASAW